MLAFEVWLNGQKICTAPRPEFGTLYADARTYRLMARRSPETDDHDRMLREGIHLSVSGIRSESGEDHHTSWIHKDIAVGDEVIIKIVETEDVDPPESVTPSSAYDFKEYLKD